MWFKENSTSVLVLLIFNFYYWLLHEILIHFNLYHSISIYNIYIFFNSVFFWTILKSKRPCGFVGHKHLEKSMGRWNWWAYNDHLPLRLHWLWIWQIENDHSMEKSSKKQSILLPITTGQWTRTLQLKSKYSTFKTLSKTISWKTNYFRRRDGVHGKGVWKEAVLHCTNKKANNWMWELSFDRKCTKNWFFFKKNYNTNLKVLT